MHSHHRDTSRNLLVCLTVSCDIWCRHSCRHELLKHESYNQSTCWRTTSKERNAVTTGRRILDKFFCFSSIRRRWVGCIGPGTSASSRHGTDPKCRHSDVRCVPMQQQQQQLSDQYWPRDVERWMWADIAVSRNILCLSGRSPRRTVITVPPIRENGGRRSAWGSADLRLFEESSSTSGLVRLGT